MSQRLGRAHASLPEYTTNIRGEPLKSHVIVEQFHYSGMLIVVASVVEVELAFSPRSDTENESFVSLRHHLLLPLVHTIAPDFAAA